ncbi:hypothetical protein [Actinotalea sp. K2]|uniref:hypothetical protein n=1 Tax=Actinotalea sp. K2 TaxID=2939438 RepID=UPI002017C398|nr:hypothetical protein [Actinotalea sp. K2]MCL3862962.1 hypothetical protein [Actinotalea sp. K2]
MSTSQNLTAAAITLALGLTLTGLDTPAGTAPAVEAPAPVETAAPPAINDHQQALLEAITNPTARH